MKHGRNALFGSKADPVYRELIEAEIYKSNLRSIKLLTIISVFSNLLLGLGLDLSNYYFSETDPTLIRQTAFLHIVDLVLLLLALFAVSYFETRTKTVPPNNNILHFRRFTICYGILFLVFTNLLTIPEEYNTSRLLIYTLGLTAITAFITLNQKWSAIIFSAGLAFMFALMSDIQYQPGILASSIVLIIVITSSAYIISSLVYNNFVQKILSAEIIRVQQKSIEESNRAKDAILSVVAHDLRTPVINIDQLVDLVMSKDVPEQEHQYYLSLMKESCTRAYQIIDDLLDISQSKLPGLHKRALDIQEIITGVLTAHSKRFSEKQIMVDFHRFPGPVMVEINQSKFERVLDNLFSNAIKFTPREGKVKLSCYQNEETAIITLQDNGIGIPANLVEHLFEPFSKAGRTGIEGEKTTGLGLSIVKNIVEQHGGNIKVNSKELKGTSFVITLPSAN